jgi:hypothetical protein
LQNMLPEAIGSRPTVARVRWTRQFHHHRVIEIVDIAQYANPWSQWNVSVEFLPQKRERRQTRKIGNICCIREFDRYFLIPIDLESSNHNTTRVQISVSTESRASSANRERPKNTRSGCVSDFRECAYGPHSVPRHVARNCSASEQMRHSAIYE